MQKNICHDCQTEIEVQEDEIKNGVLLEYDNAGEKINVFKCNECYKNNPGLNNFQKCEIYSRVVGYYRPVQQYNVGKQQEYAERKEFKQTEL